jgi:hypothetical protein
MPEIQARSLEHRRRVSAKTVNRRVTAVLRTGFGEENEYETTAEMRSLRTGFGEDG